ncbi:hypothetical protein AB0M00_30375 [Streptomyces chartreusis]|uniref:hypothetical protein n=1 Tax=Streptomyces chartreusis TaxID=1969 RepID=UPI00343508A7
MAYSSKDVMPRPLMTWSISSFQYPGAGSISVRALSLLRLTPRHGTTESIREAINTWVGEEGNRATATWSNNAAKPLVWSADGKSYTPTGLAAHIFRVVTGRRPDSIRGTTWWDVDPDHVPDKVDPDEWAALAGTDLAALAKQLRGATHNTRKDWTSLHALLGAIPSGRWTTYGDVAAVIGSHAVPVGAHLATREHCPAPWRVLTSEGKVSAGFRWTDATRTDTPADILCSEGVRFSGDTADPNARLQLGELRDLLA